MGEVAVNAVNEATGAVGDSNTYEFSDPNIPTATSDTAYLRLILHVNGAGQVRLLKSVAVVEGTPSSDGTTDIVLLTDPSLYPNFTGIARRVATAFYDFGDAKAVAAVQNLVETATSTAVVHAVNGGSESEILSAVQAALDPIVDRADVDAAYLDRGTGAHSFLTDDFMILADVQAVAAEVARLIDAGAKVASDFGHDASSGTYNPFPTDPLGGNFSAIVSSAEALRDSSIYGDTHGIDAVVGVVVAAAEATDSAAAGSDLASKTTVAQVAAETAWHNAADIGQAYNRFLADSIFSGLPANLLDPSVQTALAAQANGDDEEGIAQGVENALLGEVSVQEAYTAAEVIKSASLWGDTRAVRAVDALLDGAAESAAAQVRTDTDEGVLTEVVKKALEDAFGAIEPDPVFPSAPSGQYSDFVTGSDYAAASNTAAETAASEVFFQYEAGVSNPDDLTVLTGRAVSKALIGTRNQAAALPKNSIALDGSLSAGEALDGEIYLPALAPTNPFLHRLHPDHPEGFPITRRIALIVDSLPDGTDFARAGYGVSRLSGTYSEEIFGLHKPLGNNRDIGLKTEGTFTLNRLTLVDTLNF